jgi:uncharacterized protein (DUF1800 family)
VSVSPGSTSVRAGDTQPFTATVTGTATTGVTWSVNGMPGGNATVGTINTSGVYKAPDSLPSPSNVTVQAASIVQASAVGASNVSLLNPIPVLNNVNPKNIGVGAVTLTATGSKFAAGATILFGNTALTTIFVSPSQLTATFSASGQAGAVPVTVRNPDPGAASSGPINAQLFVTPVVSAAAAARFLEQATFGPTPDLINQVQQVGFLNFLQDQFDAPQSTFDDAQPDAQGSFDNPDRLQRRWFTNALYGQDQLRQRMAFALHKIWVVSWVDANDARAFVSYLRMHEQHAFGNYRQIMEDVTKNPAMGRYQDIANNDGAANRSGSCNENYGRELMQLFTIGLWKLNANGTFQFDAQGNPIPAYDPVVVVEQNACAMTGWTYAKETPATRDWPRPTFYGGPLEAVESHHDKDGETLIDGFVVPPGGTAQGDLTLTLDNMFCHPNLPPFIARLLIQQLVTSNPSPAYVQRVASVWTGGTCTPGGTLPSQRGDMKALITAILLDSEARRGDLLSPTDPQVANDGKLKEPVLLITNLLRALGAQSDGNLAGNGRVMGQNLLFPPTVFSYFSPEFEIPETSLLGPEFNIQTTATTFERINFINTIAFGSKTGTTVDFTSYANLAPNPNQLLDSLNALLLHGNMSSDMRTSITTALNAVPSGSNQALQRAQTAIYLVLSSTQYQVQH